MVQGIKTGITSTNKGNKTEGNSWMINGDVVKEQKYKVIGKKIVHNHFTGGLHLHGSTTFTRQSTQEKAFFEKTPMVKVKEIGRTDPVGQLMPILSAEGESKTICVQRCPGLENNWISKKTAKRLHYKAFRDASAKEDYVGRHRLVSTGKMIAMNCAHEAIDKGCRHHFYVFEGVPFDMIVGKEFT
ncbi:MAG: hypothetical protein M1820_009858 [Bogoriella megaspora]|nr:MAG: hypothetical protein M1820_009858 [Bogoriella megaspora]